MEVKKKSIYDVQVISNEEIAPHIMKMVFDAPEAAAEACPGQFINVYPKAESLILPRPISICDADAEAGTLTIVYDVVGAGTAELENTAAGESVRISSPLGNGFNIVTEGSAVLLGGGVGSAPMVFLAKKLAEAGVKAVSVTGFRKDPFLTEELKKAGCRTLVTTDVPTEFGFVGNVVDCMEINHISGGNTFYACGPKPMLAAVVKYVKGMDENTEIQVSLEERMGCGYGACVGCVVDIRDEEGNVSRKKVCKDGPVFAGEAVVW